jgi:WD40 repeat protein
MKLLLPLLAAVLLLTVSACSSDDDTNPTPMPTLTTSAAAATPEGTPLPSRSPDATIEASATATTKASPAPDAGDVIDAGNFSTLRSIAQASVDDPQYMAWQPDGKLLAASRSDVVLIDSTGATQTIYTAAATESIVGVSKQGQIAVSSDMVSIQLHDLSGNAGMTITTPAQFGSVDFSDDGTLLATTRLDKIAVEIWNTTTGQKQQEVTGFDTAAPVYSATLSPNKDRLIWHARATIQLSALEGGHMSPRMEHEDFVSVVAMSSDEGLIATTWGMTATLWNPDTGERIHDLEQDGFAAASAFLPDNDLLVVATANGLTLWNTQTFEQAGSINLPNVRQIAVSEDGAELATIDQNGQVQIWAP